MYSLTNETSRETIQEFGSVRFYGAGMELSERIRKAREAAGLTQEELAAAVGHTRGAVAQWEGGTTQPRRKALALISRATGKPTSWLEHGIEPSFNGLYAVGEVAAGLWKEGSVEYVKVGLPVAPHPDYPAELQRLYQIRGESVNRIVQDGEYIHCVSVQDSAITPQHGDLVVVRRMEHDLAEYTAKRLIRDGKRWILRPESNDKQWQADIVLDGDDSTNIMITDIIIAKWSPIMRLR